MPIKKRPLTPLMIEALTSYPSRQSSGQWAKKRQINALMARNLVKKNSLEALPDTYRFRLTTLGIRIKTEILSLTSLARDIVSGGPHKTYPRAKRIKPNFLPNQPTRRL